MALAGFRGGVFLRDSNDDIRIYMRGRLHLDFHAFGGAGVGDLPASDGGTLLTPRFFARRARLEVAAELFRRWFALFGVDSGGQPITNPTSAEELAAAPPGQAPTAASARYAPLQTVGATAVLANVYIDYTILGPFHLMLGQIQSPFSMENRTGNNTHSWMERTLPIRAFVVPNSKEIGATLWGDWNSRRSFSYELGLYSGDGPNRPQVDAYPDFIGRIVARPFASPDKPGKLDKMHVGLSVQRGARDPKYVGYDYPAITTGQGFTLWDPRYRDQNGHLVRVLPSGSQFRFGGELRLPVDRYELRAEAYWVNNGTRESLDGQALAYTERLGAVKGVGWYVQLSAWPFGDPFVNGDPGYWRPPRLDLSNEAASTKTKSEMEMRGLELLALAAGVQGEYDGASRGGVYDAKTPGGPGGATKNLSIVQLGLGATYWYTSFVRLSVNYLAYHTPGSDSGDNLALVPGNLLKDKSNPARSATWMHEVGGRMAVSF